MALIGNCTNTTYASHKTKTEVITFELEDGTTGSETVPLTVSTSKNYTNVYLCIKQVEFFVIVEGGEKFTNIHYQYAAYSDLETRNSDQEDFLFWNTLQLQNHDHAKNLYSQIYTEIKLFEGLTNLTND